MTASGFVSVYDKFAVREQDALGCCLCPNLEGVVQRVPEETLLMSGTNILDDHMTLVVPPHDF